MKITIRHRVLCIATLALIASITLHAQTNGSLFGRIISYRGRPAVGATVRVLGTTHGAITGSGGEFRIAAIRAGTYTIEFQQPGSSRQRQLVTIQAGRMARLEATLYPTVTGASLAFSSRDTAIAIPINRSMTPGSTIHVRLYRVLDPVGFYLAQRSGRTAQVRIDRTHKGTPATADSLGMCRTVREWDYTPTLRLANNVVAGSISLGTRRPGVYVVETTPMPAGQAEISTVVISDLGIILKRSADTVLAFAVDAYTGRGLPGVLLTYGRDTSDMSHAVTGRDGTILLKLGAASGGYGQFVVVGRKNGSIAIGSVPGYTGGYTTPVVHMQTDRPVYRPGQTVFYRGIARRPDGDGAYLPILDGEATVRVTNEQGQDIYSGTHRLSDLGTFSGELCLAAECHLGRYNVQVEAAGGSGSFEFVVAEYRKPEFDVTVATAKKHYLVGEHLTATVRGAYFFGAPVANAVVDWSIYRIPISAPASGATNYTDEGHGEGKLEMIHTQSGKLGPDGVATLDYPIERVLASAYTYQITAVVVDPSRRAITGSTQAAVSRSNIDASLSVNRNFYHAGERALVKLRAVRRDGSGNLPVPYRITALRRYRAPSGDTTIELTEQLLPRDGLTDSNGDATIAFTAERTGTIELSVTAGTGRAAGELTTATASFMTIDERDRRTELPYKGLRIVPARDAYAVGDTIEAMLIMPAACGDVLLGTETTRLVSHDVRRFGSRIATIRMPAEARLGPNFFLTATAVARGVHSSASAPIDVARTDRALNLAISAGATTFKPGDSATITVRATDARGRAVANAEIALASVDEAVFAIEPDRTPSMARLLQSRRANAVGVQFVSRTGFPLLYPGNNRLVVVEHALDIDNTARPVNGFSIRGGRVSETQIRLDAVDVLEAVYATSTTSVNSGTMGRTMISNQATFTPATDDGLALPRLRSTFKDVMAWAPALRTDSSGRASLGVRFPDNLTTWRVTARGVTATMVGEATAALVARKNLLVRMETPRFVTQGDSLLLATTVHNYLSTAKRVTVRLTGKGAVIAGRERTITIEPNADGRIDWPITVPGLDSVSLKATALTDEESDQMEMTLPIVPRGLKGRVHVTAAIAALNGADTMTLDIPAESVPATRALTIRLSPSIGGSMIGALDDLIGYPYGCAEQTMTRFLPTVVVANTMKVLGRKFDDAKQAEIPKMVATGLDRLYGFQHADGGWGWWEHDQTNSFMTAYIMYGLTVAQRAGFKVSSERYERGARALRERIDEAMPRPRNVNFEQIDAPTLAYMLFVSGMTSTKADRQFYRERIAALAHHGGAGNYALALLALAARAHGDGYLADSLAPMAAAQALADTVRGNFAVASHTGRWQSDPVEAMSYAIRALMGKGGPADEIEAGANWLMAQRQGSSWQSTRQTAMALFALTDYVQHTAASDAAYEIVVKVNGRVVATRAIETNDRVGEGIDVTLGGGELRPGGNEIVVEKRGSGRLDVAAWADYYCDGPAVRAHNAGFGVDRQYFVLRREERDGRWVYVKEEFDGTVRSGDELLVKVKVSSGDDRDYFMLEDPLPAGCELERHGANYTIVGESEYQGQTDAARAGWSWWYSNRDDRDEKIAFFASSMAKGDHEFSYILRAQIPGTYGVMPAVAMLNYFPGINGTSAAERMTILE